MKTQINIQCEDEKDLIEHLHKILLKIKKWGGKKESEGLYFTDEGKGYKRTVSIDSDL